MKQDLNSLKIDSDILKQDPAKRRTYSLSHALRIRIMPLGKYGGLTF